MKKKGYAIAFDNLIYWIIGIVALALFIYLSFILSGKGFGAINFIKNLFSFGR